MQYKSGRELLSFQERCVDAIGGMRENIERFFRMIDGAKAIHVYGFGRSGAAALALAIRLGHFADYIAPVSWMGDIVRPPVQKGDLVILVSGSGERTEVLMVAEKSAGLGGSLVLITADPASSIARLSDLVFVLPRMKEGMVYGGGDFELGAYLLQEIIVTEYGRRRKIPGDVVGRHHV
jgi:D-arabinose 5-phosphate isomerase GutQ